MTWPRGRDVAGTKKAERKQAKVEAAASKTTLAVLLGQWDALGLAQRRASYRKEAVRAIKAAFPNHLERRADALTRADAIAALDRLLKADKATMAGRTLAYSRACFTWAAQRGKVPENPFLGIPVGSGTVERDRVLAEEELTLVWRATEKLGWPFGPIMRILILTAQRREEVGGMRWSELARDRAQWTIPKKRAKNDRAHVVHLMPAVNDILATLPRVGHSDLVFTTNGKTPVSGFSRAKTRLDALVLELQAEDAREAGLPIPPPLEPWRVHDYRRTAVTWMAGNGVAPHVADKLLNHVQGTISGVAAIYQRGEFLPERKAALLAWADHVIRLGEAAGNPEDVIHDHG